MSERCDLPRRTVRHHCAQFTAAKCSSRRGAGLLLVAFAPSRGPLGGSRQRPRRFFGLASARRASDPSAGAGAGPLLFAPQYLRSERSQHVGAHTEDRGIDRDGWPREDHCPGDRPGSGQVGHGGFARSKDSAERVEAARGCPWKVAGCDPVVQCATTPLAEAQEKSRRITALICVPSRSRASCPARLIRRLRGGLHLDCSRKEWMNAI
jgi:hypothetical protein